MGSQLLAPSLSSAHAVAAIVSSMSNLKIDVSLGNGKDVKMKMDQGDDLVEYKDVMAQVAKMVDMYPSDDATCASLDDVLAHAGRVDTLAASWLPLAGPTCTDEQREGVKGDLLRELQALNERLASSEYLLWEGTFLLETLPMLPNVLSLFQYVLGEDVRNSFGNISAWVGGYAPMNLYHLWSEIKLKAGKTGREEAKKAKMEAKAAAKKKKAEELAKTRAANGSKKAKQKAEAKKAAEAAELQAWIDEAKATPKGERKSVGQGQMPKGYCPEVLNRHGMSGGKQARSSVDWSRSVFTMDDTRSAAVNEAFVQMHEKGLIYRDNRLVNWCCKLKTAVSDIEVDYIDVPKRMGVHVPGYESAVEFGAITSFAYPYEDGSGEIVVATTRPETMLGDSAVAVHPDDDRYKDVIGKFLVHPINGRKIPIIADAELVDPEFGTGAVKITPAHDPNDFATGKRHNLEFINILDDNGCLNSNGTGKFAGQRRFDARITVVEHLKEIGLYRGVEDNPMRLDMAADACDLVRKKELEIIPEEYEATWFRWMENIRDWCISRQLWWGHRIPAYYILLDGEDNGAPGAPSENMKNWVVGRTHDEARKIAEQRYPGRTFILVYLHSLVRDAHGRKMSKSLGNVIDPINVIEGITLDALHQTLLGGNLDPKEIEKAKAGQKADFPDGIEECGADALRFALVSYTSQGKDINLDIKRVVSYRHWCNKLWNAIRFAMMNLGDDFQPEQVNPASLPFASKWILSRLSNASRTIVQAMYAYDFSTATSTIYSFWQYELCDIFIELAKPAFAKDDSDPVKHATRQALYICLESGLRLLHPFMPFVTEELWQRLPGQSNLQKQPGYPQSLIVAEYPNPQEAWKDAAADRNMAYMMSIVTKARALRSDYGLTKEKPEMFVSVSDASIREFLKTVTLEVATLTSSASVKILASGEEEPPSGCGVAVVDDKTTLHLVLAGVLDAAKEIEKLEKKKENNIEKIEALKKRISSETYVDKTPETVKQADQEKLEKLGNELDSIIRHIDDFKALL
eukprot:jgi/Picre1/28788/NNA_004185.t1